MAIDIIDAHERKPEPLDFIIPGFLHGTVGAIFSAGGSGKSMLTLETAMAVACNVDGGDLLDIQPQANGRVVYLAAEDPELVIRHRIHDMTQSMPWQAVHAIADRLDIEPMVGTETDLFRDDHLNAIIEYAAESRLVVIDTISRFHSADENSNSDMAQLVNRLEKLGNETGAAVLFLHHANKSSGRDGTDTEQSAIRGASSLIDNSRWGASLRRMTSDEAGKLSDDTFNGAPIGEERRGFFVRFDAPKNNYGSPMATQWYERKHGGVLRPVEIINADPGQSDQTLKRYK